MKNLYEEAKKEVLLDTMRIVKQDNVELFCYSRECFMSGKNWNDITRSHRGQLYYKQVPVNYPMSKIFNLDEVPETNSELISKRLLQESYEIYDKCNGHLVFVSCFLDDENEQQMIIHTKGGLPNDKFDLLKNDIALYLEMHGDQTLRITSHFPYITLMFEAIVEHDKHTLYDKQCEMYNIDKNGFILLAANVYNFEDEQVMNFNYDELSNLSRFLGCNIVKRYEKDEIDLTDLSALYEHKDIEGYVIRFLKDDFRLKIKTKEYWALRFKNDLSAKRIIRMFNTAGFDRIEHKLPEEVAKEINSVIASFYNEWYHTHYIKLDAGMRLLIKIYHDEKNTDARKEFRLRVVNDKTLTRGQKTHVLALMSSKQVNIESSTTIRHEFIKFLYAEKDNKMFWDIQEQLEHIVDNIGKTHYNNNIG